MNKKVFLISALALGLFACQQTDKHTPPPSTPKSSTEIGLADAPAARDNASASSTTESAAPADSAISERIKQVINSDSALSFSIRNIQVTTQNGVVTLKGPVRTSFEKNAIGNLAQRVPGVKQVDNQLEVTNQ